MSRSSLLYRSIPRLWVATASLLLLGLIVLRNVSAFGQPSRTESEDTQPAAQATSESDGEEQPAGGGWIEGERQAGRELVRDRATIEWTSPGGGPDHAVPVIGPRLSLKGHFPKMQTLAVSPDGKLLASCSSGGDQAIRLRSLEDGRLVSAYEAHEDTILALAFSPDGRWLASGSADKTVLVREITEGDYHKFPLKHPGGVRDLEYSPDGNWLAVVCKDPDAEEDSGAHPVTLWDTRTWQSQWQESGDEPSSVVFSPDSQTVAVAGHHVTLWDVATGTKRRLIDDEYGWRSCCGFSPDGKKLLITERGAVRLLNVADGKVERTFWGRYFLRPGGVTAALSPDGRTVATRAFVHGISLVLWDAATGRPLAIAVPEDDWGLGIKFTPDGKSLVAGVGSRVFVWDVPSGGASAPPTLPDLRRMPPDELARPRTRLKGEYGGGITSLAFSADGTHLAAGTYNGPLQVWNMASGRLEKELRGHHVRIDALAFSPDGLRLASGGEETTEGMWEQPVRVWQWKEGRVIRELEDGHDSDYIRCVRFSADGKSLLEVRSGPDVVRWDLAAGEREKLNLEMEEWRRVVVASPAGDRVAVAQSSRGFNGEVTVWDLESGKRLFTCGKKWSPVASLAFSRDSRVVAAGLGTWSSRYGEVKLIDANTGEVQVSLKGHLALVSAIAISPDGQMVASGSEDMTVKIWDTATGGLRTTVPAHRGTVRSLAFSPDGTLLASGSLDDSIKIWDVERLRPGFGSRVQGDIPDKAAVIAEIEKLGGTYDEDEVAPGQPIRRVDLNRKTTPDAWLKNLRGLAGLRELDLDYTFMTDAGLEHLIGQDRLESLSLRGTNITDSGLALLSELPNLQSLSLSSRRITSAGLQHLTGLSKLESLDLNGTATSDEGLKHVSQLTRLKRLVLRDTLVTDTGLAYLQSLTDLEELDLGTQTFRSVDKKPRITDLGLKRLKGMTNLKKLDLTSTGVSSAGLRHLSGLTQLEQLDLTALPVSDAGLAHLSELTNLRRLGLQQTKITDAGLEHLRGLNRLETLLIGHTGITDAGLEKLSSWTGLKGLDLSATKVTDAGLARLKPLVNLEILHAQFLEMTDSGLAHLAEFPRLKYLSFQGAKFSGAGLKHLGNLKDLQELYLYYSDITDTDLEAVGQVTTLTTLNLQFNKVTDAGLEHLRGMTKLEYLVLVNTEVTAPGVKRLQQALPECTIYSDVVRIE